VESLFRYTAPPTPCGYLPDQVWSLEYEYVGELSMSEYLQRMLDGWRRFGNMMFRPACPHCRACQALRVRADQFRPDRSQRRVRKANEGIVSLQIGPPQVTRDKLSLYDRFHAYQSEAKGWPEHAPKDPSSYAESFVEQPFEIEEWCYYLGDRLIGVGYVDHLPEPPPAQQPVTTERSDRAHSRGAREKDLVGQRVEGLSAIYFFYDPDERSRSPGTWNVLCLLEEAVRRGLPYVYLGYYVSGCQSMEYKPRFTPNEVRGEDGVWRPFR
jgi:arginyl-tRNA--protein-N-Asp/Glu arginylyltransferase